jgi:hypothetical protein
MTIRLADAPVAPASVAEDTSSTTAEDPRLRLGTANWRGFWEGDISLDRILSVTRPWAEALRGVERPWLCWNVDSDWCLVQQKLVASVGWTPVVGWDPRVGPPELVPEAIAIDFNHELQLPVMWLHFPLEFAFLFADRLAFWHADLMVRKDNVRAYAQRFAALADGAMIVTNPRIGWRHRLSVRGRRYWELVGCTTRGASRSQFEQGAGWWMNFQRHPNCPSEAERQRRSRYYWDCGAGIFYWHTKLGGRVQFIAESEVEEGHCSRIHNPRYKPISPDNERRNLAVDLKYNYDLGEVCRTMGLADLLPEAYRLKRAG